jgi:hypothetical protein
MLNWGGVSGAAYLQSTGGSVDTGSMDISDYVGNYSKGAYSFNRVVQTGVSVDLGSGSLTAWFNGQYFHTVAEAHLLAVNLLLSTNTSASSTAHRMMVRNAPMPSTPLESSNVGTSMFGDAFAFSMAVLFALNVSF